jgi:hypothetical protein
MAFSSSFSRIYLEILLSRRSMGIKLIKHEFHE